MRMPRGMTDGIPPRIVLIQRILGSMFHEVQSPSWSPVWEMHAQRSFLVRQRSTKIPADRIRHYVIIFLRIVVQRVLVVQMIGQRATEFVSEKRRTHSLSLFFFPSGENFQAFLRKYIKSIYFFWNNNNIVYCGNIIFSIVLIQTVSFNLGSNEKGRCCTKTHRPCLHNLHSSVFVHIYWIR